MKRSALHAEAIRIHRAMVEAPPGEQVTVLFAALLNFVPVEREGPACPCGLPADLTPAGAKH